MFNIIYSHAQMTSRCNVYIFALIVVSNLNYYYYWWHCRIDNAYEMNKALNCVVFLGYFFFAIFLDRCVLRLIVCRGRKCAQNICRSNCFKVTSIRCSIGTTCKPKLIIVCDVWLSNWWKLLNNHDFCITLNLCIHTHALAHTRTQLEQYVINITHGKMPTILLNREKNHHRKRKIMMDRKNHNNTNNNMKLIEMWLLIP